jgi:ATP-binding cassette, subfamily B, bacterial
MEPRRHSDVVIVRRLFQQAYPLRRLVAGVFLLNVLAAPLALLTPLPLKVLVDHVLDTQPLPPWLAWLTPAAVQASRPAMLVLAVSLVVFIALLVQAQTLAKWVSESLTSEKLVLQFRSRLFRHVQRLSLLYHDRAGSTDPLYRIQYDAPAIQWVLVHGLTPFFTSGLTVLGMLYIAGGIHWQMAAVAGAVAPVLFALSEFHRRRIRVRWHELKQVETSSMSVLEETLGAIRVVQAFGQEDRQLAAYEGHATTGVTRHVSLAWIDGSFGALAALVIAGGTALALYLGAQHVQAGMLTLGELLIVMTYIAQLHTPMKAISGQIGTLQGSLVSAARAFALLDQAPDVVDNPSGRPIARGSRTLPCAYLSGLASASSVPPVPARRRWSAS